MYFKCKTLVCFFQILFLYFIHELKWLWAVTNQFFTALWTDGCSKNTSILAVSHSLDLPKQHCRHFIQSQEEKNHCHISSICWVITTQPTAADNADTQCLSRKTWNLPLRRKASGVILLFWCCASNSTSDPLCTSRRDTPGAPYPAHPAQSAPVLKFKIFSSKVVISQL